jgi:hypothetical protein
MICRLRSKTCGSSYSGRRNHSPLVESGKRWGERSGRTSWNSDLRNSACFVMAGKMRTSPLVSCRIIAPATAWPYLLVARVRHSKLSGYSGTIVQVKDMSDLNLRTRSNSGSVPSAGTTSFPRSKRIDRPPSAVSSDQLSRRIGLSRPTSIPFSTDAQR